MDCYRMYRKRLPPPLLILKTNPSTYDRFSLCADNKSVSSGLPLEIVRALRILAWSAERGL